MGQIEEKNRKRTKRNALKKVLLETIKFAGILTIAVAAPNVLGAMHKLGMIASPRQGEVIRRALKSHRAAGLIVYSEKGYSLTEKGESELRRLTLKEFASHRPRRWDGKWRVLMFDVPERDRRQRDRIREMLQLMGCVRLQDSVWVLPHDCEDMIALVKVDLKLGKRLVYLIAEAIEGEDSLKRHFKLT